MSEAIAFHEAGHAAMAAIAGAIVEEADIIPQPGQAGQCFYRIERDVIRRLTCTLAGPVAEMFFRGRGNVFTATSIGDKASVESDIAEQYNGKPPPLERTKEYQLALRVTKRLLAENWGLVEGIAKRLQAHQKVSGAYVHACRASYRVAKRQGDNDG